MLQSTKKCVVSFLKIHISICGVSVVLMFMNVTIIKTKVMVMKMLAMATTVWSAEMARAMEVAV